MDTTNPYSTTPAKTHEGLKRVLWVVLGLGVAGNIALNFGPLPQWITVFPGAIAVAAIAGLCAIYVRNRDR